MNNKTAVIEIKNRMADILQSNQMEVLEKVLCEVLNVNQEKEKDLIQLFIFSKKSEGKSNRTEIYYTQVLRTFEQHISDLKSATTEEIRQYLFNYQDKRKCSAQNIDNIRRILSSFYNWLENEDYIIKSPMRRIKKMKIPVTLKSTYTEEEIENMRESLLENKRNAAIFDFLMSSGVRISELVSLDIDNINFENQCAIVHGKGNKERFVYFDTKAKLSLKKYLSTRMDSSAALFTTSRRYKIDYSKTKIKKENRRLSVNMIERFIRECGKKNNNIKAYPHKFRRTMATKAIDKGMPIEQVQVLLGHTKIDTTLRYAQVQQKNVKNSYLKYIG